ncbi:MAG: tetratricopeptide repeat protein [Candidatus Omnitrophica bacterium]|nr:tetratricopeptide repeat protein [Candidatus Omnitrophota bacterium]
MFLATFINKINLPLKKANYTISIILIVVFFLVLFAHLNREVRDLDLWLHLKTGEQISATKAIASTDPYSFTKEGAPWINHEWLFQLLSYKMYERLGFDGLIILQNIVFTAVFLIMFVVGAKNRKFLFVSTMLFIFLLNSSYRFTVRPDMFSVLLLAIFLYILKEKSKYLYILPLLQIIWSNLHGFFLIGPLVIFIFALTTKNNKKLWVIFILSLLATLVNPQFIKGALYPLFTLAGLVKNRLVFDFIQELRRPITMGTLFDIKAWFFYKALIVISAFSFRFNQKKFNLTLFILWLVFLLFSLAAIRNIIYFAVVATIAIFYNANERFSYDKNLSNEKIINKKYYFIGRYSLMLVFSICMVKNAMINTDCRYYDFDKYEFRRCMWGISTKGFPKKAVGFIIKEKLPQRMFNDFNSGSYLVGRAYPLRKVFIDGRTEFYGNDFLKTYREVTEGNEENIKETISKYNLQGFLLTISESNFDKKLAKYLFENPEWKTVYFNGDSVIFLKDNPENKNFIEKFNINLNDWVAPKAELEKIGPKVVYPYDYISRGRALEDLGCFQAAISEAREALKIMPDSVDALVLIGNCFLELEEYSRALEGYRLALAINPKSAQLRNKFALALYKLGNFKEAEAQLLKVIKQRPKDAQNYHALSMVYRKQGQLDKAKIMSEKACTYNKNKDYKTVRLYADILYDLKEYKEALKVYERAKELNPENAQINETIENIEKIL